MYRDFSDRISTPFLPEGGSVTSVFPSQRKRMYNFLSGQQLLPYRNEMLSSVHKLLIKPRFYFLDPYSVASATFTVQFLLTFITR